MRLNDDDDETMVTRDEQRLIFAVCLAHYGYNADMFDGVYHTTETECKLTACFSRCSRAINTVTRTKTNIDTIIGIAEMYGVY